MNNEFTAPKEESQKIDKVINILEGITNDLKDKRDYDRRDESVPLEVDTYKYTRLEIKHIDKEFKKSNVKLVTSIIVSSAIALGMGVIAFNNPEAVKSMDLGSMIETLGDFIKTMPIYRNLDFYGGKFLEFNKKYKQIFS